MVMSRTNGVLCHFDLLIEPDCIRLLLARVPPNPHGNGPRKEASTYK